MKSGLVCDILELVYAVLMKLSHNELGLCSYCERAMVIMRGFARSNDKVNSLSDSWRIVPSSLPPRRAVIGAITF